MNWGEGALRARSFSAVSPEFSGTRSLFSSLREPELTLSAFGFRWNPQIKISYALALVLVNLKYIAILKLTMNWVEGAFRARSFSATSPQFSGTRSLFSSLRELELTLSAFGFLWIPDI